MYVYGLISNVDKLKASEFTELPNSLRKKNNNHWNQFFEVKHWKLVNI